MPHRIQIISVNESGASIYSASEAAREEFPGEDVTVQGGRVHRRLSLDPLAELVKIDPKSIGVGQYQHDVDQPALKRALDDVVMSCVNAVGVEVNTASAQLLGYVSGLGPALAKAVVAYRDENGPFQARKDLKKVPRLGPKAFEQSAGFLRTRRTRSTRAPSILKVTPLWRPWRAMPDARHRTSWAIRASKGHRSSPLRYGEAGLPTSADIMAELARPGGDPSSSTLCLR